MRTPNLICTTICSTALLLAAATALAAGPTVTIQNTPLPITGSVALSGGTVSATLSGTPSVSATITNSATNPVRITNNDRPTPYYQVVSPAYNNVSLFPIPTGCRLVVQAVSYFQLDPQPTQGQPHAPLLFVGDPGLAATFFIGFTQQTTVDGTLNSGTLVIPLVVDYDYRFGAQDLLQTPAEVVLPTFSVSGYLLPLTPGARC